MADTQTRPVPHAPADTPAPDWRHTLRQAGRCWFGALLLVVALTGLFAMGYGWESIGPIVVLTAAAAVLATLLALVIESLSGRQVPIGGHVLLAAASGAVVLGVLALHPGFALLGAVLGGIAGALGGIATSGRPTWRRYTTLLAGAVVLAVLLNLG